MPRIAIVGNGESAARHLAAGRRVADLDIVALAGQTPVASDDAPPWTADYRALLDRADIEAIDVCAPSDRAGEIAVAAARSGKHVIMEHLPGSSEEDADHLVAVCREAGVTVRLLRPDRYQPLAHGVKTAVEAGKLGPIRYAHAASIWGWPPGEQEARRAWGVALGGDGPERFLIEHATGTLDLLRWFFDVPVATVFARACPLAELDGPDHYVSIVLCFADAPQAICEIGRTHGFAPDTGLQRLALTGLRGSAYHDARDCDVVVGSAGVRPLGDDPVEGVAASLADWIANVGGAAGAEIEDGRTTLRLTLAAVESLRTGQPVTVDA